MEIEAKFALDAAQEAALRAKLQAGPPAKPSRQRDVYLATAGLPVAMRIRTEEGPGGPAAFVTLKSGFEKVAGIRVREEWEPTIRPDEVDSWLAIFDRLGLPAGEEVLKSRETFDRGTLHVVIDRVDGLGTFCEVEAVADDRDAAIAALEAAIAELGLGDLPRITRSYRGLLADART